MPKTRYTKSGDANLAYQVVGDGPIDLLYLAGWVTNIEAMWEDPGYERFLNRLASIARLIMYDKRGVGLSDPVPPEQLTDQALRIRDAQAVMDAADSEKATLFGHSEGGATSLQFAADYPERVDRVIVTGAFAKRLWSEDYPWAPTLERRQADAALMDETWANPREVAEFYAPSRAGDEAFTTWLTHYLRMSASPGTAAALHMGNSYIDVTSKLASIQAPTLLLFRIDDADVNVEEGRYMATRIPNVKFVELPGGDHFFWAGDAEAMLQEIEEFVTGQRGSAEPDRVVATILFTDIMGSTELAASLGDAAWRDMLHRHDKAVRDELTKWRGREVKTTGDGVLATFDSPTQAIRFAKALLAPMQLLGIKVRCGIHTGEIELRGDDVAGLAVHIAARVAGLAGPSEVLVSRTVRDLVAGTGMEFEDRGAYALKGVPDKWEIYAVA